MPGGGNEVHSTGCRIVAMNQFMVHSLSQTSQLNSPEMS